ncbi:hypothetical protein [Streptomyces sp. NPDC017524]|uniref:hypothetical protein n=1 Tax=unclassified Streptomyces TaxID=2593676 RepID=UPI00379FBB8B
MTYNQVAGLVGVEEAVEVEDLGCGRELTVQAFTSLATATSPPMRLRHGGSS